MEFNPAFSKIELCSFLMQKGVAEDDAKKLQGKPDIDIILAGFLAISAKLSLSTEAGFSIFAPKGRK